jgi:hypothetical protein
MGEGGNFYGCVLGDRGRYQRSFSGVGVQKTLDGFCFERRSEERAKSPFKMDGFLVSVCN